MMLKAAAYLVAFVIEVACLAGIAIQAPKLLRSEPDELNELSDLNGQVGMGTEVPRSREIRLQPVAYPMLFVVFLHTGVTDVIITLEGAIGTFLGLNFDTHVAKTALPFFNMAFTVYISTLVYRVIGGTMWKCCILPMEAFKWILIAPPSLFYGVFGELIVTAPFWLCAGYTRVPTTGRLTPNALAVPKSATLRYATTMAAVPLAVMRLFTHALYRPSAREAYISEMVAYLSVLILLLSCAVASAISVKRAQLAHQFQWQWRAFLTPVIPLLIVELGLIFVSALPYKKSPDANVATAVVNTCAAGTCGVRLFISRPAPISPLAHSLPYPHPILAVPHDTHTLLERTSPRDLKLLYNPYSTIFLCNLIPLSDLPLESLSSLE